MIFVTHDVRLEPGRFGCTPEFFDKVVQRAVASGARILPVARAFAEARGQASEVVSVGDASHSSPGSRPSHGHGQ